MRKIVCICAVLAFLWGIFLRFYDLGHQSYWLDEAYSINAAQEIVEKGVLLLDSGQYYDRAYIYHYVLAGFLMIDNDSVMLRIPSVIFSLLSIWVVFGVAKRLFPKNPEVAWITVILMSLAYWDIAWARQARMYSMLSFFSWLSIYFALGVKSSKDWKMAFPFLLAFLVAYDTHKLAILLVPIILYIFLHGLLVSRFSLRIQQKILIFLVSATFIFGLLILLMACVAEVYLKTPFYGIWVVDNLKYYVLFMVFTGIFYLKRKENLFQMFFLAFTFFSVFTALAIYTFWVPELISYRHIFLIYPSLYIIAAFCISMFLHFSAMRKGNLVGALAVVAVIFLVSHFSPSSFYQLESDKYNLQRTYYSYTPQPNFNEAFNLLEQKITLHPDAVVVTTLPAIYKSYTGKAPDYWLEIVYDSEEKGHYVFNEKEFYTGASVISSLEDLKILSGEKKIILLTDFFSRHNNRTIEYDSFINSNFSLLFKDSKNRWSEVYLLDNFLYEF